MAGDEPDDPIADTRNVIVRLRYADHNAREPHRMDRHGGARHDERPVRRHRERHADGMPAAENDARRRLAHSGDHLGKAEPRFNVAADGVEQYEQCADILRFLHCGEQRHDVLVLGRFRVRRQHHMSFDLPDDRDAVDLSDPCGAKLTQGFLFSFLHAATLLRRSMPRRAHLYTFFICGN